LYWPHIRQRYLS